MPAPVLSSINPEIVTKGSEFTLEAYGDLPNNYTANSVIEIDGVAQPTTFIQFDLHLEALVGFSITGTTGDKAVKVKQGGEYSMAKSLVVEEPKAMKDE